MPINMTAALAGLKPERTTKVTAVFNSKLNQWRLCHNGPCGKSQSSIVATILTSDDPEADEAWAKELAHRFNKGASPS